MNNDIYNKYCLIHNSYQLVFSELIAILNLAQVLSRLSTRAYSSCSSSARASISSVNRRLVIVLPLMLTLPSCSSRAYDIALLRKMVKSVSQSIIDDILV